MQSIAVKDLMVPKNQYASVTADATLRDAALVLHQAQKLEQSVDPGRHRGRAILVLDEQGSVIGNLSMLNVLRGLLPHYERQKGARAYTKAASRVGSARTFLGTQEERAALWSNPLDNLVDKAGRVRVRELIRPFGDGEIVDEEATLDTALKQMVAGRFQSLLVTRDGEITGILRLTDIYVAISQLLRAGVEE